MPLLSSGGHSSFAPSPATVHGYKTPFGVCAGGQLRPSTSPARGRPAHGQRRSSSASSRGHVRASRSSCKSRMVPSNSYAGSAGPVRPWPARYRAALASRRGAAAATLRCTRARPERRSSPPQARRCAETLRGREQRARLVVQLVRGITGGREPLWLHAGSPARARQWGRSCRRRFALGVSPCGMRGSTHAYWGSSKRS